MPEPEKRTVEEILRDHESRKAARSQAEAMWDDIILHMMPKRVGIWPVQPNTPNTSKIYDGTPAKAITNGAAVLQSMLTNRQLEWFRLEVDNPDLNEMESTKEWLSETTLALRKSLDNSNFYSQAHEFYYDLLSLCTAVVYCEPYARAGRDLYFSTRHLREVYLLEGDQGRNDRMHLVRDMSALQMIERWGKTPGVTIPKPVKNAYERGEYNQPFQVLQAFYPNPEGKEDSLNPANLPFQCKWIDVTSKQEITTDGYHEFPFAICFWTKTSGDLYGRGPGWEALPNVKMLYEMRKTAIRVAEKIADPPLQAPKAGFTRLQLTPGGVNFYDVGAGQNRIEPIQIGANFNVNLEMINDEREQILNLFFTNQLQIIDAKQMTAEEVRARIAENARILGPTFERLNDDYLEPVIYRSLGIARRLGKVPPPPATLVQAAQREGVQLRVRFVSPLAKAQVASEVQGITHTTTTAMEWAKGSGDTTVLDNLDLDIGIRRVAELDGAPQKFVRSEKDRDRIREKRQAIQEVARRIELAQKAAGAFNEAASADKINAEAAGMQQGGGSA